jgi:hypothetical protein
MPFIDFGPGISHIFSLLSTLFMIWMLIDCIRNTTLRHKWVWFMFILFTNIVGATVYFFTRGPWPKVHRWAQQTPPVYQPPPPAPRPAREIYPTYEQGYQAQKQEQYPERTFSEQDYEQPSYSAPPLQPQYEEPQIAYPEEPPLQQQ